MLNQNIKKSPGIKVADFNCTWDTEMDEFGSLNNSPSLFYILQQTSKKKKKSMAYVQLQLNLLSSPNMSQCVF